MIDRSREKLVPIKDVPSLLPLEKNSPCYETIRNWTAHGVRGIKLEFINIGSRKYTSKQAVDRFLERLSVKGMTPEQLATVFPRRLDPKARRALAQRLWENHGLRMPEDVRSP